MHYRPSFLLCFWHNRKLQKYYERVKEELFSHRVMLGEQGEIAIPTVEFNLIFQLTHIFSHLMNEGIGLRQLLDYYFVICDFYKVYRKSPRPSFLIKRAALGNLKASFHCTHWHRFFPLKRAPPLTPTLSPSGKREETALLGAVILIFKYQI